MYKSYLWRRGVITAVAIITYFFPGLFSWVKGTRQTVILGIIMFGMGLTLTTDDFKVLAKRPLDIFIGAVAQYTVMPFLAFGLVHLLRLPNEIAIGLLLVGGCPGGVSSNIMSYLCHGEEPPGKAPKIKKKDGQSTVPFCSTLPRPAGTCL